MVAGHRRIFVACLRRCFVMEDTDVPLQASCATRARVLVHASASRASDPGVRAGVGVGWMKSRGWKNERSSIDWINKLMGGCFLLMF
jgi:hypothetical protein